MKEHGILFSAPMVRALLARRKWQTRRAVKTQPPDDDPVISVGLFNPTIVDRHGNEDAGPEVFGACGNEWSRKCPHPPGTRLWVREAWRASHGANNSTHYRASVSDYDAREKGPWKPGIHMPRTRARIFRDVTGVRVERAQEISDADIAAEGVDAEAVRALAATATKNRQVDALSGAMVDTMRPAELWRAAWTLINGRESWLASPWVWVYEMKEVPNAR